MKYCSLVYFLAIYSLTNIAYSDDSTANTNPPQTNNILDKTKRKLDNANQVEQQNLEQGIQQGEGQPENNE
ncbi:hypothetical protein [Legionella waltersii]|uniref:Secreted protein n=1 Tax=Legionella waltersii TaxID=66969 RepID=A0A0W1A0M1_9GAMM|nr:hypothetical protein [Legionella waltersii]KTD74611.1 hypothetical protein Lwal_2652 [Legionella waltersii]SNV08797.1 Uncharacterised protein [Legionella waltersii]